MQKNIKEKTNKRVRNLTVAQLDILRSIFSNSKTILSSQEIIDGCKKVKGQSFASLSSLSAGETPLIIKMARVSGIGGRLWKFNSNDWDKEEAKTQVLKMIEELKGGGFFKE
ncbi:hypothetical protein ACFLZ4_01905 [Patescibacteria group bacterium]